MNALFDELCRVYNAQPNRRGEVRIPCPECGARTEKHLRCSFSTDGWHCFVCDAGGNLKSLAEYSGAQVPENWSPPPPRPKRQYWWKENWRETLAGITAESVERRWRIWQRYKPVTRQMVDRYQLGVGVLPASRCKHTRLLVPLFKGERMCGIRGRRLDCACREKWLSPAGNEKVLYGADRLERNQLVVILENPVDALLFNERYNPAVAVATLSVTYWEDGWTSRLVDARPGGLVVLYDHHRPGNGGGREEWLASHGRDVEPNGVKLANRLLESGLRVELFDYGDLPLGTDPGDLMEMEE